MASTGVKPFEPEGSLYDLTTYMGRVKHFFGLVDPRNALLSDGDITAAQQLLADHKAGKLPPGTSDAQLWDAKRKVQSAVHPDTGERIPLVFRMSTFMPSNLPITAGMLMSGTGAAQVFWQWANQSYNAGFNYANRNASVPIDTKQLALSYASAAGVAMGMSFGLGKVVQRLNARMGGGVVESAPQPLSVKLISRGLPWFAVASAGVANALAMRYKEGIDGITVFDAAGNPQGTSIAAGRACLAQVAMTRMALPVPILLVPPFLLDGLKSIPSVGTAMARSTPLRLGVELSVFAVFLQCALPFAVALFPQTGSIAAADLEPQFKGRFGADGKPIERFFYNKGV